MQTYSPDFFKVIRDVARLFCNAPELIQDFILFLPDGYRLYCPSDILPVELLVIVTPEGILVEGISVGIPQELPTSIEHLREALASSTSRQKLLELKGSSASVVLQLLLIVSRSVFGFCISDNVPRPGRSTSTRTDSRLYSGIAPTVLGVRAIAAIVVH